jgi:hypothetical protein
LLGTWSEENRKTGLHGFGVADVDFMAPEVCPRVADVVATCGVWCPCLGQLMSSWQALIILPDVLFFMAATIIALLSN